MNISLPYSNQLNIGTLSGVFDRRRISNCYKYFWFKAILEKITETKTTFSYDEILNQMIEDAWYMVTEYNLRLGPCNTNDNLEEVVKYIFATSKLSSTAPKGTIVRFLENTDDRKIYEYKTKLIVNVPYCMQSPFYPTIKSPGQTKVDEINRQEHLLYYFVNMQGIKSQFAINDEWVDYLVRNRSILEAWTKFNLIGYLQDRNPSVPGIIEKISKPEKRNLPKVSEYWKTIINIDPTIKDIYDDVFLADERISIDHFVPWQYVASDELWNLVPTTPSINSQKGNQLPRFTTYFEKLSQLEHRAYGICEKYDIAKQKFAIVLDYHVNSMDVRNVLYEPGLAYPMFAERLEKIISPVYESAKMCGFVEWER